MNKIIPKFVFKIAVFSTLLYLQGCASQPWQVTDSDIKTELVYSKHYKISQVLIFEKTTGFLIKGDMRNNRRISPIPLGHIDIDIVDSKGRVLHKSTTLLHRFGKANRSRKRYKFNTEIPNIPPEGGVVRVTHHTAALH